MNLSEITGLLIDGGSAFEPTTLRTFINAAQKLLDRLGDFPKGQAEISFTINEGEYFLIFPTRVRMVHAVWLRETLADEGVPLDRKDYVVLRALYPNASESSFFATPLYYAHTPSVIASLGSPLIDELALPIDDIPVSIQDQHDYKGLVLAPTADQTYYIKTLVTAYSKELVAGTDESFWSKHHPLLLVSATMYKLEGFLRNASSAKDYLAEVQGELASLNFDAYEDEMQGRPNYMGQ